MLSACGPGWPLYFGKEGGRASIGNVMTSQVVKYDFVAVFEK